MIAVCGLGGHALGSFKEKNGRFVWLRDALPSDTPNARILTYGYNSQLVGSESFQSLTDLGRTLQVDLEDIRVFGPERFPPVPLSTNISRTQTNPVQYFSSDTAWVGLSSKK